MKLNFAITILLILNGYKKSTTTNHLFVNAFTTNYLKDGHTPIQYLKSTYSNTVPSLLFSSNNKIDEINEKDESKNRRLSFLGASVSPSGFIALLSTSSTNGASTVLPIQISTTSEDEVSASSVEALTFLQLLAGVDMASEGVLPVQTLESIIALNCSLTNDEDQNKDSEPQTSTPRKIMNDALGDLDYATASPWQRVRVKMPKVGLNEVCITSDDTQESSMNGAPIANVKFILECSVEGKSFPVELSIPVAQDLSSSASFTSGELKENVVSFYSLALALRYKVPITISSTCLDALSPYILCNPDGNNISEEITLDQSSPCENTLRKAYPKWKSATSLQFQSSRALKTIERGFQANRLDGALRIAIEKGDKEAEQKIREKMKEFESLDDLPVASGVVSDAVVLEEDNEDSWA